NDAFVSFCDDCCRCSLAHCGQVSSRHNNLLICFLCLLNTDQISKKMKTTKYVLAIGTLGTQKIGCDSTKAHSGKNTAAGKTNGHRKKLAQQWNRVKMCVKNFMLVRSAPQVRVAYASVRYAGQKRS